MQLCQSAGLLPLSLTSATPPEFDLGAADLSEYYVYNYMQYGDYLVLPLSYYYSG